jgi:hypothetical protein
MTWLKNTFSLCLWSVLLGNGEVSCIGHGGWIGDITGVRY